MSIFLVADLKVRNAVAAPQPFLRPENRRVPSHRGWNNAREFLPLTGRHTGGREPLNTHSPRQFKRHQTEEKPPEHQAPSSATSYALLDSLNAA